MAKTKLMYASVLLLILGALALFIYFYLPYCSRDNFISQLLKTLNFHDFAEFV